MDKALQSFAILLICCLSLLVHSAIKAATSSLRSLPGPLPGRFSTFYRVWLLSTGKGPIRYGELHKKYGPIVRTGPNHVSLSDPAMISTVYNKFFKSPFYDVFKPLYQGAPMDTIFTTTNPLNKRASKHSLMVNMTSCPQEYQDLIIQSVEEFVQCMRDTKEQSIDFSTWAFFWGFDMTYTIMFGSHFGFMESRSDFNRMIDSFTRVARYAALLGQVPQWCPLFLGNNRFMTFMRRFQSFPDPTQQFLKEVEDRIENHAQGPHSCGTTFLCKMLAGQDLKLDKIQHHEVVNTMFESFFAAAVESAVTIRTIFYCLLTYPATYHRLVGDIRRNEALHDTHLVRPQEGLLKLPFLTAVIKEALRLYTSNCPPMERIVPSPGMQANGHFIPEGTIVSVAHYVTHRDTEVFGVDADSFRPERWLEAGPSALKRMDHNFMAFGKGNRACVGRELGMLELRAFVVGVLKNLDIEWASEDPQPEMKMYWIMELFGVNIRFTEVARDAP